MAKAAGHRRGESAAPAAAPRLRSCDANAPASLSGLDQDEARHARRHVLPGLAASDPTCRRGVRGEAKSPLPAAGVVAMDMDVVEESTDVARAGVPNSPGASTEAGDGGARRLAVAGGILDLDLRGVS
mmetsp:Transcript_72301/g.186474  ORF Transcript_72301/g.186474 Transcript_72301/m.186474 type:complete len:128 (+) Transcript_72301:544-927(+)